MVVGVKGQVVWKRIIGTVPGGLAVSAKTWILSRTIAKEVRQSNNQVNIGRGMFSPSCFGMGRFRTK